MKPKKPIKTRLIDAIQNSQGADVSEICKTAETSRPMFYFYLNKDNEFRRKYLESQRDQINRQLEEISAT